MSCGLRHGRRTSPGFDVKTDETSTPPESLVRNLCNLVLSHLRPCFTVAIAGESGAGKTVLATRLAARLTERGVPTGVLHQDDYFVFPPRTNHEMRRRNLNQVGPYEVKLDFLDSNLRSFKRGESPIYKPRVLYDQDRIITEEMDISHFQVLIAEGTYTSLLRFVDLRVFIDRDYRQTEAARRRRARDPYEPFMDEVLAREHAILSRHKALADVIIAPDYRRLVVRGALTGNEGPRATSGC